MTNNDNFNPFSNTSAPSDNSPAPTSAAGSIPGMVDGYDAPAPTPTGAYTAPNPYTVPSDNSTNPYTAAGGGAPNPYGAAGYTQSAQNPMPGTAPAYHGVQQTPGYQYGQQGYGYNGGYPAAASSNSTAVASLVLGILGVLFILPVIGPILALILGIVAKNQIKRTGQAGSGMATTGIVLGALGVGFLVLLAGLFFLMALPALTY